ncbi:MAG: diguanylate cyclase [Spirochaetes bacterium]|nr:diguanylate cyclase [Spirochaetota bacterium]MBN2769803.1 diguanylate cyclase [Spirochaetota bacterium]
MYTVLHIDNSHFFNKIVRSCIEKIGLTCITSNDISEAVEKLENNHIDLIITALEIRGGGGEYLIRQLNSGKFRNIPVIVMTSNDSMSTRIKMFKLGVVDYISKDQTFAGALSGFLNKLTEKNRSRSLLKKLSFAVLDDSKTQLQVISNIMSLNKIENVSFFSKGGDLLKSNNRFHIYFVDLVLPDISGEQAILQIRKKYPESLIIAVSGIDNYKVVSNVLLSGADDYILKPFNSSIFMARLVSNVRVFQLVQDLKKKNQELEESLITDPLTGLYNHRFIYSRLQDIISKKTSPFSFVFFSVDNFNNVNDTYGHSQGDKVLCKISDVLLGEIEDRSCIGRYGGVEFIVLFPGMTVDKAFPVAEKIRQRVNRITVNNARISVSGGLCQNEGEERAEDLIRKADSLLFNAKHNGKNRIEKSFDWQSYL